METVRELRGGSLSGQNSWGGGKNESCGFALKKWIAKLQELATGNHAPI